MALIWLGQNIEYGSFRYHFYHPKKKGVVGCGGKLVNDKRDSNDSNGHRLSQLTIWILSSSHLVGGWATPLKNMKVNWDDEIPNSHGKISNWWQPVTTNQSSFPFLVKKMCETTGLDWRLGIYLLAGACEHQAQGDVLGWMPFKLENMTSTINHGFPPAIWK